MASTLQMLNIGTNRNSRFRNWPRLKNLLNQSFTLCSGISNLRVFLYRPLITKTRSNVLMKNCPQSNLKTPRTKRRQIVWQNCQKWCRTNWISWSLRRSWLWSTWVNFCPACSKNLIITACNQCQTPWYKYVCTPGFYTRRRMPCLPSTSLNSYVPWKYRTSTFYMFWAPFSRTSSQ